MTTEVYRRTKLGDSLVTALEDLLDARKIDPDLAVKVLSEVCICSYDTAVVRRVLPQY